MDLYGIFRRMASDNPYLSLTKAVNSAICTEQTQKSIKRITTPEIRYGHMGQLVLKDGVCYATFIQNPGYDGEEHNSTTSEVVLAIFRPERVESDDFDPAVDVEIKRIGGLGDSCAGKKAFSIFKDNSMCLIGDRIHICFSFTTEDGVTRMFRKTYCISEGAFCDETELHLMYNGAVYDFTDKTINAVYSDKGLEPRAEGLIELVSAWSEYNGEYYATGLTIEKANNGFIVKTSDFCTMTLVDTLDFNDRGTAEIASIVYGDRLIVACRQDYGVPYLYLNAYNLKEKTWGTPYRIEDGNVRPWFFIYRNELYLLNTVQEYYRKYTNISKVRTLNTGFSFFDDQFPIETVATLADCGFYFAVCCEGDQAHFIATKDTVSYGKLALCFRSAEDVNAKLATLFS